ncbi:MAG: hypothetical protein HGA45_14110 [Chloroflexales bacterium]|nr:hypothetical protein [Chloroflexales bacterium]
MCCASAAPATARGAYDGKSPHPLRHYGHTAKVAQHLAQAIAAYGHHLTVRDVATNLPLAELAAADAIVLGSPVYRNRHLPAVHAVTRRHRKLLNRTPSAFFSVSGIAASARPEDHAVARKVLARFCLATGWYPPQVAMALRADAQRHHRRRHPLHPLPAAHPPAHPLVHGPPGRQHQHALRSRVHGLGGGDGLRRRRGERIRRSPGRQATRAAIPAGGGALTLGDTWIGRTWCGESLDDEPGV